MSKDFIGIIIIEAYADDELEIHQEIEELFEKTEFRVTESIVCEKTPQWRVI